MLKGKTVIELTNVHTGDKEVYEDTNLVTEAIADILNTNILGMLYNNTGFDGENGEKWMLPIINKLTGGILLYQEPLEERVDNLYAPFANPLIGYASSDVNNTTDVKRGSRNLTESKLVDGGFKYVWDFATSQANGTISAIALTNRVAGIGQMNGNNYMVRLGTYSSQNNSYDDESYRPNKRTYIKEGYRLELITRNNSNKAWLKKVPEEYLHAGLTENLISQKAYKASEVTEIDLGHYPYWIHRTGSPSKGEYDIPNEDNGNVRSHFFHGADGCWYAIARKTNQKYSNMYYDNEQFRHISYDYYMDKIQDGKCTTQKIAPPNGVSDFYSIGMSGKWLICVSSDSSKLYRLDTTNVANIERISDWTYNSSNEMSYIIDDDMVLNGWYMEDGEPVQKIGGIGYQNYCAWGISQMTRYKTYAIREWMYHYSEYRCYKELFLYTPYLATINNLDNPVIKTADKTMKITYTLTETNEQ